MCLRTQQTWTIPLWWQWESKWAHLSDLYLCLFFFYLWLIEIFLPSRKFKEEPRTIDSLSFVPMRRKRLFWHNLGPSDIDLDSVVVPPLQDFLDPGRRANVDILCTITTNGSCQKKKDKYPAVDFNGSQCVLNVNELERIFKFGEGFTDNGTLSISCRKKLIGNSWVIPVIGYILNPLLNLLNKWTSHFVTFYVLSKLLCVTLVVLFLRVK